MNFKEEFRSYTEKTYTTERIYEDEPISISSEKEKELPPKEYRQMRKLDFENPFSKRNEAKIFYLQAKYMENFEDDYDYDKPFFNYYPTYRNMTVGELRGYFTWRTKLRHGDLQKTSLSYVYLHFYELLHYIGSANAQEGFDKLVSFYESYRQIDSSIDKYARQWIIDYGIYYHIDKEKLVPYLNLAFDDAFTTLFHCQDAADDKLASAIMELSSYNLEKSKCYKKYPEKMRSILCKVYRHMDLDYQNKRKKPYVQYLYEKPVAARYIPFQFAVFYPHENVSADYIVSEVQSYTNRNGIWYQNRSYSSANKSKELGALVRCCDKILREYYHLTPALKFGDETQAMIAGVHHAIEEDRKESLPKVTFNLDLLDQIRDSSDQIGEKLLTEEERAAEDTPVAEVSLPENASGTHECIDSSQAVTTCPLSGNELEFMRMLLYGGDLSAFLARTHLMSSILAENINEIFYDEFMDTVIDFDGDTPVIIEDYLQDLKGMIPE
ncbi:MAG: TerB N-terminal domain-containing protein [Eubacteriales bacterium]|nr:TerB N-terminal domain-containing protein [Eubacteriales bacterium]